MKTLILWVSGKGWKPFQYENIEDLKEEFENKFIKIGDWASLGARASIGAMASIGDEASIKT